MNLSSLRYLLPTVVESWSHSCARNVCSILRSRSISAASPAISSTSPVCRHSSNVTSPTPQTATDCDAKDNEEKLSENDVVSPTFVNRNPRNLEFMGIARKRKGWKFQFPSPQFYHRVVFEQTWRHTEARVEHSSGETVVSASTKELAIARHLFSLVDISASVNIGRVLAHRCRECGITDMVMQPTEHGAASQKVKAFQDAIDAGGITLSEPEEYVPPYVPGIDYDDKEAMAELVSRQKRVLQYGRWTRMYKKLRAAQRGKRSWKKVA